MIGMRWAVRGIGLVSTLILARLLTPADFGLVAMSTLVLGLLRVFTEMGVWQLLIRSGERDEKLWSCAWTILLVQAVVLAAICIAAAPLAAGFFDEPRVVDVIRVTAAGSVVVAFANIGVVMFRRDLDFRSDFVFGFWTKVLAVAPTIALALVWRSHWALVVGPIVGHAFEVLLSYRMHPFRPRPTLEGWRRLVSFSLWITPTSIANYLNHRADVFVVGHVAGTAALGTYNVASELSRMATGEIVTPMGRAIFPNLARLKHDRQAMADAYLLVLRTVTLISFAAGFALAATAPEVVAVVLGAKWLDAVPLIAWLALFAAFDSIFATAASHVLVLLGKERAMPLVYWGRLLLFGAGIGVAATWGSITDIAIAATLTTAVAVVAVLLYIATLLPVTATRLLRTLLQCGLAAAAAFAAVRGLGPGEHLPVLLRLAADLAIYVAVLLPLLALLWIADGRPDGIERRVQKALAKRFARPKR